MHRAHYDKTTARHTNEQKKRASCDFNDAAFAEAQAFCDDFGKGIGCKLCLWHKTLLAGFEIGYEDSGATRGLRGIQCGEMCA
jgi:hypothetical protein